MSFIPTIATSLLALFVSPLAQTDVDPFNCAMIDLPTVETVLGEGATDLSDAGVSDTCVFQGAESWALMMVQRSSADFYDSVTIPQPHTAIEIGDQGRYNVDERGSTAVQFVVGDASVMISVRVMSPREGDFLPALLDLSPAVADRMK